MTTREEVVTRTTVCVNRLWDMESSFVMTALTLGFPEGRELMFLMDAVHRAQWQFERALRQAAEEE